MQSDFIYEDRYIKNKLILDVLDVVVQESENQIKRKITQM